MISIVKMCDASNNDVYPITHLRAVRDSNGTTLESMIQGVNETTVGYYECNTAGSTPEKTITIDSSVRLSVRISCKVKFAEKNTGANATMNINNTGAKPLFYNGVRAAANNSWYTNEIVDLYFDGTNYQAKSCSDTLEYDVSLHQTHEITEVTTTTRTVVYNGDVTSGWENETSVSDSSVNGYTRTETNTGKDNDTTTVDGPTAKYDTASNKTSVVYVTKRTLTHVVNDYTFDEAVNAVPMSYRHGGLKLRFISNSNGSLQNSDNKYVQYRLMTNQWSTTPTDWQGVDDEPTAGSDNLVKSGGVAAILGEIVNKTYVAQTTGSFLHEINIAVTAGDTLHIELTDESNAYSYYSVYGGNTSNKIGEIGSSKLPIDILVAANYNKIIFYSSANTGNGGNVIVSMYVKETIAGEIQDIKNEISSLSDDIGDEETARQNADTALGERIDATNRKISSLDDELSLMKGIKAEITKSVVQGSSLSIYGDDKLSVNIPDSTKFSVLLNSGNIIEHKGYTLYGYDIEGKPLNINSYNTDGYGGYVPNRLQNYIVPFRLLGVGIYITGASVLNSGSVNLIVEISGSLTEAINKNSDDIFVLENKVSNLSEEIQRIEIPSYGSLVGCLSDRTDLKENYSYYFETPPSPTSYAEDNYLDRKLSNINKNKSFVFFTDTHQERAYQGQNHGTNITEVVNYIQKRLNIKNVVFGGDIIDAYSTKYLALAEITKFASDYMSAFGEGFMYVQGNHDENSPGHGDNTSVCNMFLIDDREHIKRTVNMLTLHINPCVISDQVINTFITDELFAEFVTSYGNNVGSFYSQDYDGSSLTASDIKDLFKAWCRRSYYYDDVEDKIRYIVVETRDYGMMSRMMSYTMSYVLADFVADALLTTPESYTIAMLGHQWGNDTTPMKPLKTNNEIQNLVYNLMLAYKGKNSYTFNPYLDTFYLGAKYWIAKNGNQGKTYDFSLAHNPNKMLVLGGHYHLDCAFKIFLDNGSLAYAGIDNRATIAEDELLVVWTHRAIYSSSVTSPSDIDSQYADAYTMTYGTVSENAFDVVSILDNSIKLFRVGAGVDREYIFNE